MKPPFFSFPLTIRTTRKLHFLSKIYFYNKYQTLNINFFYYQFKKIDIIKTNQLKSIKTMTQQIPKIGENIYFLMPPNPQENIKPNRTKRNKIQKLIIKNKLFLTKETDIVKKMLRYNKKKNKISIIDSQNQNYKFKNTIYRKIKTKLETEQGDDDYNFLREEQIPEEILEDMIQTHKWQMYKMKEYAKKLNEFKYKIKNIRKRQNEMDIEYTVTLHELSESEQPLSHTSSELMSEPILHKIQKLPDEMIRIIGSYLPYSVLNKLIESKYQLTPILNNLNKHIYQRLFQTACGNPNIKTVMTTKMMEYQYHHIHGQRNSNYSPYWNQTVNLKYHRLKFLQLIYLAKEHNPEYAYRMLKTIYILLKPDKQYIMNWWQPYYFDVILLID